MPDNAKQPLLVGIDAGTTHIRAVIYTATGRVVAQGSAPTPLSKPQPGWAQHDGDELWAALLAALRQAIAQLDDAQRIVGLAIASVGEAAVPLDKHGRPTFAALAWFDERTKTQAEWLAQHIGREQLFQLSGLHLDPMFGICKLLWLKQHHPEAFQRTARWLHIADYLAWRLCGEAATDYSLASRTLALDLRRLAWSEPLLQEIAIPAKLFQPLRASGSRLGAVTASASEASGLPQRCIVGVGGHDHIVGALAVGAWQSGTLLDSLGTAEALLLAQEQPLFDQRLAERGYSQGAMFVDAPKYYVVGAMTTSGACVEWFRTSIAQGIGHAELIDEGETVAPGSQGVRFFPQMRVGTPPVHSAYSRGAFFGLSPDTGTAVLYRAVLEGLAYDAGYAVSGLTDLPGASAVSRILAIGGSSRNHLLMQIKASVYQQPISVIDVEEAVSLGAAMLGGLAAGVYDTLEDALTQITLQLPCHRVEPDPKLIDYYAGQAREYRKIPELIKSLQ